MKPRHHLYLDEALTERLEALAAAPGTSKSAIVADALRAFLARRGARELDDLLKVRLERISKQLHRLERDQQILLESLALFIRYQFMVTSPLPEIDQAAARALGEQRFEAFIEQVGRRIASGRTLAGAVEARDGSARAAVLAMGGRWHALGVDGSPGGDASPGGDGSLAFQPLRRIDAPAARGRAAEWLAGLLAHEGVTVTPEVKEAVWSALGNLATAPAGERTLTGLSVLLQSNALEAALAPWTLEGPFGHLLDAAEDRLALAEVQGFEMEELMGQKAAVLPVLTWLFQRLEERFDGSPTLLVLDEAWLFLDHPAFAARLRDWLKTLRKKNVAVLFATQSLADIAASCIAPTLIESCPQRIFLPNDRAMEPQAREAYARFGLNERQIALIASATPKRDYYLQSRRGNRLFDLGLGPVALAFCAASAPADQALIDRVLADTGPAGFAAAWLCARGLAWAAELIASPQSDMETHYET